LRPWPSIGIGLLARAKIGLWLAHAGM
jgi:hypothetical protein